MITIIIITLLLMEVITILVSRITIKQLVVKVKERTNQLARMETKCYVTQANLEKKTERVNELEYVNLVLTQDLATNQKLLNNLKEEYDFLSDKIDASMSEQLAQA